MPFGARHLRHVGHALDRPLHPVDDAFLGREDAGLFYGGGIDQLFTQALFVGVHFVFVFGAAFLFFQVIKATIGLRVTEEEERAGLDVEEHGHMGYAPDAGGEPLGTSSSVPQARLCLSRNQGALRVASRDCGDQAAQARRREGGLQGRRRPGHDRLRGQGVRPPGRPHRDLPGRRVTIHFVPRSRSRSSGTEDAEKVADAIATAAQTGKIGDGNI